MKQEIIEISKKEGIELIGFTDLKCSDYLEHKYELQEILDYKCSFQVGDISDKMLTNPKYKEYNSAIVIGLSYPKRESNKLHLASFSWGIDYHIVLREKLEVIGSYLKKNNYNYKIFVDNNPLDERYLAYKSGLGFFGKNNLLINEKYGSFFFIGVLLTDFICEYDKPLKTSCLNCNKCVEACPTKAISSKGILNSKKCLSYLTQKKSITEEESKSFNNCVYGCDICSLVCPHNKNVTSNNFNPLGNEIIDEESFANMSEEDYKRIYGKNACSFRNKEIIDRNIKFYNKNHLNK